MRRGRKREAPRGLRPIARRIPRGVRSRTIHQSSISGCYPSLDYLLARRSYPRRASSLFTRRLGAGCPAPRVWAKPWSPRTPANRLPVAVAVPWSRRTGTLACTRLPANRYPDRVRRPASWRSPPQIPRRTGEPARPESGPGPKAGGDPLVQRKRCPVWTPRRPSRTTQAPHVRNPQNPLRSLVTEWVAPPADSTDGLSSHWLGGAAEPV